VQEIIIIRVVGRLGASKQADRQTGRLRCMFCCKKKVGTSVNEEKGERERERKRERR